MKPKEIPNDIHFYTWKNGQIVAVEHIVERPDGRRSGVGVLLVKSPHSSLTEGWWSNCWAISLGWEI